MVATPHQLAIVAQVLEAYSIAFGIEDPEPRKRMATLLMLLHEGGAHSQSELAAALEEEIKRGFLR